MPPTSKIEIQNTYLYQHKSRRTGLIRHGRKQTPSLPNDLERSHEDKQLPVVGLPLSGPWRNRDNVDFAV